MRRLVMILWTSGGITPAVAACPRTLDAQAPAAERVEVPVERRSGQVRFGDATVTLRYFTSEAQLRVATPEGRFSVQADSATFATWAANSAALPAPTIDGEGKFAARATLLSGPPHEMRLTRVTADGAPGYQLDVSNGGWSDGVRLDAAQAAALFALLRGEPAPPPPPRDGLDAYFEFQVGEPVEPIGDMRLTYPKELRDRGLAGEVIMMYVVEADGRVRRSSLYVLEATFPEMTRIVRETLLAAAFRPARRDGAPVAQVVVQPFVFSVRP